MVELHRATTPAAAKGALAADAAVAPMGGAAGGAAAGFILALRLGRGGIAARQASTCSAQLIGAAATCRSAAIVTAGRWPRLRRLARLLCSWSVGCSLAHRCTLSCAGALDGPASLSTTGSPRARPGGAAAGGASGGAAVGVMTGAAAGAAAAVGAATEPTERSESTGERPSGGSLGAASISWRSEPSRRLEELGVSPREEGVLLREREGGEAQPREAGVEQREAAVERGGVACGLAAAGGVGQRGEDNPERNDMRADCTGPP